MYLGADRLGTGLSLEGEVRSQGDVCAGTVALHLQTRLGERRPAGSAAVWLWMAAGAAGGSAPARAERACARTARPVRRGREPDPGGWGAYTGAGGPPGTAAARPPPPASPAAPSSSSRGSHSPPFPPRRSSAWAGDPGRGGPARQSPQVEPAGEAGRRPTSGFCYSVTHAASAQAGSWGCPAAARLGLDGEAEPPSFQALAPTCPHLPSHLLRGP